MTDVKVCLITAPNGEVASSIARTLVQEGLAACANIVPAVRSIYAWKGDICDDEECLLIVKTRAALLDLLSSRLMEIHPYDTPELLALSVEGGLEKYLAWVREATSGRSPSVVEP